MAGCVCVKGEMMMLGAVHAILRNKKGEQIGDWE